MTYDRKALVEAAKRATGGEWFFNCESDGKEGNGVVQTRDQDGETDVFLSVFLSFNDAKFVVAAQPAAILEMDAELTKHEKRWADQSCGHRVPAHMSYCQLCQVEARIATLEAAKACDVLWNTTETEDADWYSGVNCAAQAIRALNAPGTSAHTGQVAD